MKNWFKQLRQIANDIRERESAQRNFVRAVYGRSNNPGFDYEKPAYLRRARAIVW